MIQPLNLSTTHLAEIKLIKNVLFEVTGNWSKLKLDPKLDAWYVIFFWSRLLVASGGCLKSGFWTF